MCRRLHCFVTNSRRVAISGSVAPRCPIGRGGFGLLLGVVLTQRPDLFAALDIGVPLLDMKRYNQLLAGASWMGEYGNPDVPEDWEFIKKYSPYQNLDEGKEYPQVLFYKSTLDDRVHPSHARKMAARTALEYAYFVRMLMPSVWDSNPNTNM